MSRRSALVVPLAAPLAEHSKTQGRRKSVLAPNNTPSKSLPINLNALGTSPCCPIDLSSEDDESGADNDGITPVTPARKINKIRDDATISRPQSARPARSQQPTTPDRGRPQPHTEPLSDPGPVRAMQAAFRDRVVDYRQTLPCGKEGYLSPDGKWSMKHRLKCPTCRDQHSGQGKTQASEDEGVSTSESHRNDRDGNVPIDSNRNDGNSSNDSNNNDEKSENEQEAARVPENQNASVLHHKLTQAAKEKLTPSEQQGYLYILRSPELPGLLKLGCSINPERRAKQHERDCGLTVIRVHISNCVVSMKRAERLAKIDMEHLKKDWNCSSCSQTHEEWFQVDKEKVKKVTRKWIKWINEQNPYTSTGEVEPMWEWLMKYERIPRHDFADNDHEARWAHWDEVLLPPSRTVQKKFNDRKTLNAVNRQSDSKATPRKDLQSGSKEGESTMVRQTLTMAEQASSQVLDAGRNAGGDTYININNIKTLNVNRDYVGNAPKVCLSRR